MRVSAGAAPARVSPWSGFTLLELIAVLLIFTIVATLLFPGGESALNRAREASCMANMRGIHLGLRKYLNDNGDVWPQGPSPSREEEWEQFWSVTLSNYGVTAKIWQCPSIVASLARNKPEDGKIPSLHYVPTIFSATPHIADRWATQPWLIERANAHGHGSLICFPDGSVKPLAKVMAEQGFR